jgi:hypothetical protein
MKLYLKFVKLFQKLNIFNVILNASGHVGEYNYKNLYKNKYFYCKNTFQNLSYDEISKKKKKILRYYKFI